MLTLIYEKKNWDGFMEFHHFMKKIDTYED